MTFVQATILPNRVPAQGSGPVKNGYVYEKDTNGNITAIVITGVIEDGNFDSSGALLGLNWSRTATLRIEGAQLAGLPAAINTPDLPTDPRYQAIMGIVLAFVKQKWADFDAQWQAANQTTITIRTPSEVAALPQITPAMIAALSAPPSAASPAPAPAPATTPAPTTTTPSKS